MEHSLHSVHKKSVIFVTVFLSFFLIFQKTAPLSTPVVAYNFPIAQQAFKKLYSADLSVSDAKTQPWFESYETLYIKLNLLENSDPAILTPTQLTDLLNQLVQKELSVDTVIAQFQAAQIALKRTADSVFSS